MAAGRLTWINLSMLVIMEVEQEDGGSGGRVERYVWVDYVIWWASLYIERGI